LNNPSGPPDDYPLSEIFEIFAPDIGPELYRPALLAAWTVEVESIIDVRENKYSLVIRNYTQVSLASGICRRCVIHRCRDRGLALSSIALAFMRSAMKSSSSGETIRSSVEMAYQLGFERQTACVVRPETACPKYAPAQRRGSEPLPDPRRSP
jgi:hypothetical protein